LTSIELPKKEGIVSKTTTEAKQLVKGAGDKVLKIGDKIKSSMGN
jgi:hypothetical protein